MRKKLTKDSFSVLRSQTIVLNDDQKRIIRGGGYFDDFGIGYYDSRGNYYWFRTQEDNTSSPGFSGDSWSSITSSSGSGSGLFNYNPSSGYGTSANPISIEDYNTLARMGNDGWNGGYVDQFGYVNVYASSVEYGNSIYDAGSWRAYGDYCHPVSKSDFYELVEEGRWHGGYVQGTGYVAEMSGGGIDDNDCFFEAVSYIGNWLNSNDYGYSGWLDLYGQKFGIQAQLNAIQSGVLASNALDLLDDYFTVSQVNCYSLGSEQNLGFLNAGSGGHAVLVHSYDYNTGLITYFDPDSNSYNVASPSEFFAIYSVGY